ncbi:beta-lactamase/transpeptidase-like protein [Apodospora peruviana]|uniref:Beta-lactamase/transpeptidase-like protein n=1 Tax=Apodospora peruviana TaxID=516989 RepID=A0AAE0I279_9PEZI|nr:beta-lactamase/transpeptidase-like protein [Apodospora peruviana]
MTRFNSSGLAIAVISGNQTWARGFGHGSGPFTDGGSSSVTPYTLFRAGSTTKSQIAAALAILVSSGQLNWSTPVSTILGEDVFSLHDTWSTEHMTAIDLLSHRTGYPRYDVGVLGRTVNETIHRLRYLRPATEPRQAWQYQNEMFTAAGAVVAQVSGMETSEFLKQKLWEPMGMLDTQLLPHVGDFEGMAACGEYFWNNDTQTFIGPIPKSDLSGGEGAGGVVTNVVDYAVYLRNMMGIVNGTEGSVPVLGEKNKNVLLGTHMFRSPEFDSFSQADDGFKFFTAPSWYGLGWIGDYVLGELAWHHDGGVGEARTDLWFFPRLGKGFAVMQNSVSPAVEVISREAVYEILGTPEGKRLPAEQDAAQADLILAISPSILYPEELSNPPPAQTAPSWTLAEHVGKYVNPGFVDISLSLACGNSTSRVSAPDSPAHPTRDENGCFLRTSLFNTASGWFGAELEHVNADKWLAWAYNDAYHGYFRPLKCLKVIFEGQGEAITRGNFLLRVDTLTTLEEFSKVE